MKKNTTIAIASIFAVTAIFAAVGFNQERSGLKGIELNAAVDFDQETDERYDIERV